MGGRPTSITVGLPPASRLDGGVMWRSTWKTRPTFISADGTLTGANANLKLGCQFTLTAARAGSATDITVRSVCFEHGQRRLGGKSC